MDKTLGLDLGTNSLGWAILDNYSAKIVDKGVLIFPEGMEEKKSSLETPAAKRRAKRMARRMKFRRKMRKWMLLKVLIDNGMCPLEKKELEEWKKHGKYPVENELFKDWLKATDDSNPYCDRAAAAEGKVEKDVLGRALYHICQRRGFKSSRKDVLLEEENDEQGKKKAKTETGKVKSGIKDLSDDIEASGAKTLGQYFYRELEEQKGNNAKKRIRGRYTGRIEHYEKEFRVIMDAQGIPEGDELRKKLHNAIFYQRPLRSQRYLVGKCPLEPRQPRAQIGHPLVEEFRMWCFVNNLSFDDANKKRVDLTQEDRVKICEAFKKKEPTFKFKSINTLFKKDPRFKEKHYTFHYYKDKDSVPSCSVRYKIATGFGGVPYDEQKVFDALSFFDDDDKLVAWLKKHHEGLTEEAARKITTIRPPEGNAKYSLKAIRRILPFLREGHKLSDARLLAGLSKCITDFETRKDEIVTLINTEREAYKDYKKDYFKQHNYGEKLQTLSERYEEVFGSRQLEITSEDWKKWFLNDDSPYSEEKEILPKVELGMIRNPTCQRSMTMLRRLVNYLMRQGKIDKTTTIRIELARTVNDIATRKAWQEWQDDRKKLREKAEAEIKEHVNPATGDAIERYLLWKEQDEKCLYTGRTIPLAELFTGGAWDIEHTIPRSRSGDDSLANKTICEAKYNRFTKQGKIPTECANWDEIDVRLDKWRDERNRLEQDYKAQNAAAKAEQDPAKKSKKRIEAKKTWLDLNYWRDKVKRFEVKTEELEDPEKGLSGFKKRQLVDTGLMSKHAVKLLKSVYPHVQTVNGRATSFARGAWGIQEDEEKDRSEHTHHAKDAMVIAALDSRRFQQICEVCKDDGKTEDDKPIEGFPQPWEGFAKDVNDACATICVKHLLRQTTTKQSSKRTALAKVHPPKGNPDGKPIKYVLAKGDTVRGALHDEFFYGCIKQKDATTGEEKSIYVVRKPLEGMRLDTIEGMIEKIVDPKIRAIVQERCEQLRKDGITTTGKDDFKMASGVPIRRVRIKAKPTNPLVVRTQPIPSKKDYKNKVYATVAEGSNFRMAIFRNEEGELAVETENSFSWAQNHKKPDYMPRDKQPGFVGYVKPGVMALTYPEGHPEEVWNLSKEEFCKRLYKVVKFKKNGRMTLQVHTEARSDKELSEYLRSIERPDCGETSINLKEPSPRLLLVPSTYLKRVLFEGVHFRMAMDGTIKPIEGAKQA